MWHEFCILCCSPDELRDGSVVDFNVFSVGLSLSFILSHALCLHTLPLAIMEKIIVLSLWIIHTFWKYLIQEDHDIYPHLKTYRILV